MSDFGDFDSDDAIDTEPPDPEQVAMRLHKLRLEVDALAGSRDLPTWDALTPPERELARGIGISLVDWLVMHPSSPEDAARSLHNVRRYLATSPLPTWEALSDDERSIGVSLMALIIAWLKRQGALT